MSHTKKYLMGLLLFICVLFTLQQFFTLQVAIAGAALGWLKDNLGLLESAKDSQNIAEKATENGSVVFVPAFSGLYAPYWRQDARG